MTLSDLHNDQVVRYRIGRAGEARVNWGPWNKGPIYVARRQVDLPKKYRGTSPETHWRAGSILTLRPRNGVCAEFGGDDWSPEFRTFNCEDYYLEIEGLV